ncbi:hypothetical protein LCGC14_0963770 [marine sediment metagenome]|uniref:Uncharacterized protein n=1 Tax=marine sediment metagenome TaxID=412755 RepID=A0A0F9NI94_9ZZZZ
MKQINDTARRRYFEIDLGSFFVSLIGGACPNIKNTATWDS